MATQGERPDRGPDQAGYRYASGLDLDTNDDLLAGESGDTEDPDPTASWTLPALEPDPPGEAGFGLSEAAGHHPNGYQAGYGVPSEDLDGTPELGQPRLDLPQFDEPRHDRPPFDRPHFDQPHLDEQQHDLPRFDEPQHDLPPFDRAHFDSSQLDVPQHDQSPFDRPSEFGGSDTALWPGFDDPEPPRTPPAPAVDPEGRGGAQAADPSSDLSGPPRPHQMSADMLTADTVLRAREPRPTRGWRRTVYQFTGGRVNMGLSPAELHEREIVSRVRTPLTGSGCHRLAVISLKGGVGKTTTTAALGAMLATMRADRVVAVDANPDRGTLGDRVPRETDATVRDLLAAGDRLTRYADVRAFTSQSPTRLEVLASDVDPGLSQAFSEQDYRRTVEILERFYNLVLTDCGTGLLHSAMQGILGLADSLVVVSSASLDGARSASATLDWLEAHGFADVVNRAVTVISTVRPGGGSVDVDRLEDHFARRCRAVVSIPYDRHLESGGVLEPDELEPDTREAYHELAAEVGEGFGYRS